ncbi:MAG: AAA family ATPase [Thermoplasmata archaeon]
MIENISINNFKSINQLRLDCNKINLFIGEPNTGKSNILEAISLFSWAGAGYGELKDFVRLKEMSNLFYDELIENEVEIELSPDMYLKLRFENDIFKLEFSAGQKFLESVDYHGDIGSPNHGKFNFIKYFDFKEMSKFNDRKSDNLKHPHGENMFAVIMANNKYREIIDGFFKNFGYRVVLRTKERTFELQKQEDNIIISYPWELISDTLRRVIFYTIAVESNENSTLILEEPGSKAFPYYVKYLAELITEDKSNQFFIATHNPYFLRTVLEKGDQQDVNVFATFFQDFRTVVKRLNDEQKSKLLEYDPFLWIDKIRG